MNTRNPAEEVKKLGRVCALAQKLEERSICKSPRPYMKRRWAAQESAAQIIKLATGCNYPASGEYLSARCGWSEYTAAMIAADLLWELFHAESRE